MVARHKVHAHSRTMRGREVPVRNYWRGAGSRLKNIKRKRRRRQRRIGGRAQLQDLSGDQFVGLLTNYGLNVREDVGGPPDTYNVLDRHGQHVGAASYFLDKWFVEIDDEVLLVPQASARRPQKGERVQIFTNKGNIYLATVVSAPDEFGRQWVVELNNGKVVPFHESDGKITPINDIDGVPAIGMRD